MGSTSLYSTYTYTYMYNVFPQFSCVTYKYKHHFLFSFQEPSVRKQMSWNDQLIKWMEKLKQHQGLWVWLGLRGDFRCRGVCCESLDTPWSRQR